MYFERLKAWTRTLRFRLMMWNAAVIMTTAMLILFVVRTGVKVAIQYEMDQVLIEDVYEIELALADAGATTEVVREATQNPRSTSRVRVVLEEFDRKAVGHENHGWFAYLRSQDGELLWSSRQAPADAPPLANVPDFRPHSRPGQRIVQSQRTTKPFSPLLVQVGISTLFLERAMEHIDQLVVVSVLLMLLTAPPTGYWLAARNIRPLAEMTQATSRYRPEKLDERLPQRHTGDELDQLASTVNGLLDRLHDYLSHHRDFLANSAHELRTPLAAIRAAVEVAMDGRRGGQASEELLAGVLEECSSLETLVNQLLFLAETENQRLKAGRHECDLSALVARACRMFQAVAESREIELRAEIDSGLLVEGNSHHLKQVVNNLIDNALKFTSGGGRVYVTVESNMDGFVELRVRDTGVGMTAEDASHVFERFFRADRARTHEGIRGGTGLGLSICQAVVDAHGGTITVDSAPGAGSTFTVRLPMRSPSEEASAARCAAYPPSPPPADSETATSPPPSSPAG